MRDLDALRLWRPSAPKKPADSSSVWQALQLPWPSDATVK
jgi:hypothetical protein